MMLIEPRTLGRFRLLEMLGEGGMARVYRAVMEGEAGFSRMVALKIIHPHLALQPEFTKFFLSEGRLGGYLCHPNIVETLDLGETEGCYYLAMEYVPGAALEKIVSLHIGRQASLPIDVTLQLMIEVCHGLDYAHRATDHGGRPLRMVHRDLKPSNILVGQHGQVKICDFGVARADSNLVATEYSGIIKGTVRYMSPEQAWGRRDLDHRSDLFAVGAVLHELLTLEPIYAGLTRELVLRRAQDAAFALRLELITEDGLREHLAAVLQRALAPDPSDRYTSAGEMAGELEQILKRCADRSSLKSWSATILGGDAHVSGERRAIPAAKNLVMLASTLPAAPSARAELEREGKPESELYRNAEVGFPEGLFAETDPNSGMAWHSDDSETRSGSGVALPYDEPGTTSIVSQWNSSGSSAPASAIVDSSGGSLQDYGATTQHERTAPERHEHRLGSPDSGFLGESAWSGFHERPPERTNAHGELMVGGPAPFSPGEESRIPRSESGMMAAPAGSAESAASRRSMGAAAGIVAVGAVGLLSVSLFWASTGDPGGVRTHAPREDGSPTRKSEGSSVAGAPAIRDAIVSSPDPVAVAAARTPVATDSDAVPVGSPADLQGANSNVTASVPPRIPSSVATRPARPSVSSGSTAAPVRPLPAPGTLFLNALPDKDIKSVQLDGKRVMLRKYMKIPGGHHVVTFTTHAGQVLTRELDIRSGTTWRCVAQLGAESNVECEMDETSE